MEKLTYIELENKVKELEIENNLLKKFKDSGIERFQLLSILGLFDRPVPIAAISAVSGDNPIAGLWDKITDTSGGYNQRLEEYYEQAFPYIGALDKVYLKQSSGTMIRGRSSGRSRRRRTSRSVRD